MNTEVVELVNNAFKISRERFTDFHKKWISVSYKVGGLLPNSLLVMSIQRAGELDLLLRCMEADVLKSNAKEDHFFVHYQMMFSEYWIGAIYESVRLLQERKLKNGTNFDELAHHLRMLRIPLEKHEIAADKKLDKPLPMHKAAAFEDGPLYHYAPGDNLRCHIMPIRITTRGSLAWQVIDPVTKEVYWLERQELSDRVLQVLIN